MTDDIIDTVKEPDLHRIFCRMIPFLIVLHESYMKEKLSYCTTVKFSWRNYIHPNQLNLFFFGPKIKHKVAIITEVLLNIFSWTHVSFFSQGEVPIKPHSWELFGIFGVYFKWIPSQWLFSLVPVFLGSQRPLGLWTSPGTVYFTFRKKSIWALMEIHIAGYSIFTSCCSLERAFLILCRSLLLQSHMLHGSASWEGRGVFDTLQEWVNLGEDSWRRVWVGRRVLGDGSAGLGAGVSLGTPASPFPPVSSHSPPGRGSQSALRSAEQSRHICRCGHPWCQGGNKPGWLFIFYYFFKSRFAQLDEMETTQNFRWTLYQRRNTLPGLQCSVSHCGDWGPFVPESPGDFTGSLYPLALLRLSWGWIQKSAFYISSP